jgi:DNA-binding ferritin-like protein (Dps family)
MATNWIEWVTGSLDDKKRWRAYKARVEQLPAPYRTTAEGVQRYLMYTGPGDGDTLVTMFEDLADLFEQSAAAGTPIRDLVGDDPLEFVEEFKRNYGLGSWLSKEQRRLLSAVERAEAEEVAPS